MRKVLVPILLVAISATAAIAALAQQRGPSTPEERKHAVEIATFLENDPLNKNATNLRSELLRWIVDVPDLTVYLCTSVLGEEKLEGEYQPHIATQLTLSEMKFVIEHPDKAADEYQMNLAGVEGALKVYKNIKKARPEVRMEPLEKLLAKQHAGQLGAFVKDAMTRCK